MKKRLLTLMMSVMCLLGMNAQQEIDQMGSEKTGKISGHPVFWKQYKEKSHIHG